MGRKKNFPTFFRSKITFSFLTRTYRGLFPGDEATEAWPTIHLHLLLRGATPPFLHTFMAWFRACQVQLTGGPHNSFMDWLYLLINTYIEKWGDRANKTAVICKQQVRERDYLGDPGVDGRIILRRIFRKWDVGLWIGSIWLRIGTGGGHLWMR